MAPRKSKARSASRSQKLPRHTRGLRGLVALLVLAGIGAYIYWHYHRLQSATPTPLASVNAPENKAAARLQPTFDFYQLLPKIEVPVSETGANHNKQPAHAETNTLTKNSQKSLEKPVPAAKQYVLQVGSFRQFADADALKAKLSLLGFEVNVHHYQAEGNQEWYQVWVGPYASAEAAQKIQSRLAKNQVNSLLRQV